MKDERKEEREKKEKNGGRKEGTGRKVRERKEEIKGGNDRERDRGRGEQGTRRY